MGALAWIVLGGVMMSGIALLGAVTFLLPARVQQRLLLPLVAFSAGSLLGSAFFHMDSVFGPPPKLTVGDRVLFSAYSGGVMRRQSTRPPARSSCV